MIRVVIEETPSLYALALFPGDVETLTPTFERDGATYYRVETHAHYVLYRRAISGWGAATGGTPDAAQR